MRTELDRSSRWCWSGLIVGLTIGFAAIAHAKLQCPSDTNVGRKHAAVPISATANGQPIAIPSSVANLVFKTEFDAYPTLAHVEVFDPNGSPPVRILHLSRNP